MDKSVKYWAAWIIAAASISSAALITQTSKYKAELNQPQLMFKPVQRTGQVQGVRTVAWRGNGTSKTSSSTTGTKSSATSTSSSGTAPTPTPTPPPKTTPTPSPTATPTHTPTPTATPTPSPTPSQTTASSHVQWGAYVGDSTTDAAKFENLVGKKMNIQALFVGFDSSFPSEFGPTVRDQGKTMLLFWEPYSASLDDINSGSLDSYIKQFAADAKSYGGPVILAPFHEMNGDWDPWDGTVGGNSPAKVITAWKHVHDLFSGASNVKFGWAVNNESEPNISSNSISTYYPGSSYVDYVGIDGFNFNNPWQTFNSVFTSALSQVKGYNKPIYIFSMASAAGTQKPSWITDALTVEIPNNNIAGWVWFNQNKEQNWLINSDPTSLSAFKAALP